MHNILITGGNGVLGSALANMFLMEGNSVSVLDIVRKDECWRLQQYGILDKVDYLWRASQDLSSKDLKEFDVIADCAIGFPDRPFGTDSPRAAIALNIEPAIGLLEAIRNSDNKPTVIYPSSFNSLYGNSGVYEEFTPLNPTTVYGWTKSAVEQLYKTYRVSFGVPAIVTRVGSSYGEMMRTDELVAKLTVAGLQGKPFKMRSPQSKRLWTYIGDVVNAYKSIIIKSRYFEDEGFHETLSEKEFVLNIAGNKNDEILSNMEVARLLYSQIGNELEIIEGDYYEPGELINGRPVDFTLKADWTRKFLGWSPQYSLSDGFRNTINWFNKNMDKVGLWNH